MIKKKIYRIYILIGILLGSAGFLVLKPPIEGIWTCYRSYGSDVKCTGTTIVIKDDNIHLIRPSHDPNENEQFMILEGHKYFIVDNCYYGSHDPENGKYAMDSSTTINPGWIFMNVKIGQFTNLYYFRDLRFWKYRWVAKKMEQK
jgi:hypothetical protein